MRDAHAGSKSGQPIINDLDDVLVDAPFHERHTRRVNLPMDQVWPALLSTQLDEIALFGQLMKVRMLPGKITGRPTAGDHFTSGPMLKVMTHSEFTMLREDSEPIDGRGLVVFGAVGKFWKPIGNTPLAFDTVQEQLEFDEPGYAIIAASLEAVDHGDHVELITETRVAGTDQTSNLKFAPYWALIRVPSGLIRRSWLAAIERTARGTTRAPQLHPTA